MNDIHIAFTNDAAQCQHAAHIESITHLDLKDARAKRHGKQLHNRRTRSDGDENRVTSPVEFRREVNEVAFAAADASRRIDLKDSQDG